MLHCCFMLRENKDIFCHGSQKIIMWVSQYCLYNSEVNLWRQTNQNSNIRLSVSMPCALHSVEFLKCYVKLKRDNICRAQLVYCIQAAANGCFCVWETEWLGNSVYVLNCLICIGSVCILVNVYMCGFMFVLHVCQASFGLAVQSVPQSLT